MSNTRKIIIIDEEKCNGCRQCVDACAEGAIQMVDGKAKLVSDSYCDGLGACLGECPQDAIKIIERPAEEFDEQAVLAHKAALAQQEASKAQAGMNKQGEEIPCGCPGMMSRSLKPAQECCPEAEPCCEEDAGPAPAKSQLGNWPVQLKLVPVNAPYLDGAQLLLAADCVPFAFSDFHRKFLAGRILMIACPKLDDTEFYLDKLTRILSANDIKDVTVLYMEVPCCFGLVHVVKQALAASKKNIALTLTKIGIEGNIIDD